MRDPRDQIVSRAMLHGGAQIYLKGKDSFDLDEMLWLFIKGGENFTDIRTACEQQLKWYLDDTVYSLTYETLTRDTLTAVTGLLTYLDIDPSVADIPVQAIIDINSFESLTGRKRGDERIRYHRKAVVGDYRNKLKPDMLEEIHARAGDLIERLGYRW